MNEPVPPKTTSPTAAVQDGQPAIPPAPPVVKSPPSTEEQMELYEADLKENDWGHQPC